MITTIRALLLLSVVAVLLVGSASARQGTFWHFTDTHWDEEYKTGGDTTNMCHGTGGTAGPFGDYHCDAPQVLINSTLRFMTQVQPEPQFIVWTGDELPHSWGIDANRVLKSVQVQTDWLRGAFPNTRVFPLLGNHDVSPSHQMTPGPNWLFDGVSSMWSSWLSPQSLLTFRIGGYYSELAEPGFRIVAVNTVFYYFNDALTPIMDDPAGQFNWLDQTLNSARLAHERVLIIGHVPPGSDERNGTVLFHSKFNEKYLSIVRRYSDIVIAHLYGHQHSDSFKLVNDEATDSKPEQVILLSPSVTTWYNNYTNLHGFNTPPNNPSIRLYMYDRDSDRKPLTNYFQFWSNLTLANIQNKIEWDFEYSARDAFGFDTDINPDTMSKALSRFVQDDSLFQTYFKRNEVLYPLPNCTGQCKITQVCSMRYVNYPTQQQCLTKPLPAL